MDIAKKKGEIEEILSEEGALSPGTEDKDKTEKKGITEVIIGKQRNGPVGTVELRWLDSLTKFANLEHRKNDKKEDN